MYQRHSSVAQTQSTKSRESYLFELERGQTQQVYQSTRASNPCSVPHFSLIVYSRERTKDSKKKWCIFYTTPFKLNADSTANHRKRHVVEALPSHSSSSRKIDCCVYRKSSAIIRYERTRRPNIIHVFSIWCFGRAGLELLPCHAYKICMKIEFYPCGESVCIRSEVLREQAWSA